MPDDEKLQKDLLPPFHLDEAYPSATSIFSLSLPPLAEIRDDALIVLDTNVLLVPYTINPKSLDDIKRTYALLIAENRLLVPAQVAREFAKNRTKKIIELFQSLSRKRNKLDALHAGRYPLLEPLPEYTELLRIEKEIDEKVAQHRKVLGDILNHIRSWRWNDSVSELYRELFQPPVIVNLTMSQAELQKDLERRITNRIPPGFKDLSKDDLGVGDLIIWQTILQVGREQKRNVIFVSGEEKSDWWYRSEGEALYPRFELVSEFMLASENKSFHIVKFSELLDLFGAQKQVVAEVRSEEVASRPITEKRTFLEFIHTAEHAVLVWFFERYPDAQVKVNMRFPDFIIELNDGRRIGVEVMAFRQSGNIEFARRLREVTYRGSSEINEGNLSALILVTVFPQLASESDIITRFRRVIDNIPDVDLVVGVLDANATFSPVFDGRPEGLNDLSQGN